jgi:hypothetical protein
MRQGNPCYAVQGIRGKRRVAQALTLLRFRLRTINFETIPVFSLFIREVGGGEGFARDYALRQPSKPNHSQNPTITAA